MIGDGPLAEAAVETGDAPASGDAAGAPTAEPAAILRAAGPGWWEVGRILIAMASGYHGRLVITFVLGVARVAALIGVGLLSALVVRAVSRGEPTGAWLVSLLIVAPLAGLLHWLESWLAHDMAYRLLADMRMRFFRKLVELGPAYLASRRTGDLLGVATHDIELIEYFFAHTITPGLVAVLVPAVVLATLATFGWPMALAVLPFLAYAALSPVLGRARIDRLSARAREASGELNAHTVDSVQGLGRDRRVPAGGAARRGARRAGPGLRGCAHALPRRPRAPVGAPGRGHRARRPRGDAGGRVARGGGAARGRDAAAAHAARHVRVRAGLGDRAGRPPARRHARGHPAGPRGPRRAGAHRRRARRAPARGARKRPPSRSTTSPSPTRAGASPRCRTCPSRCPRARWSRWSARPARARPRSRACCCASGTRTRAPSRSAATTCDAWRLEGLRREIALVAQDTHLFNDTLGGNIRIARPEATVAEVAAAIERASLLPLVRSLPEGLDTRVGERGLQLSGGQRQRVAIARAFLREAPVLILDEATSHLDAVNEQVVQEALAGLTRSRTTIVIAHRLSTVRAADQIVVLDEGRVVEQGRHDDLLRRRGLYARLVSRQVAAAIAS